MHRAVHHGTTLLAVVAGALVVVGGLAAPLIRSFVFPHGASGLSTSELDLLLRLTFLLLGVALLADGYFAVLRGIQRSDVESRGRLLGLVVGTSVLLIGLVRGWSVWALLAGAATQDLVAIAVQAIGVRRLLPRLRFRVGPVPAVATGAVIGGIGLVIVAVAPTAAVGIAGFAVLGLGLCVVVPQSFSAAGRLDPGSTGVAIARVNLFNYIGFVVGAALIGAVATSASLRLAFVVPAVLTIGIVVLAPSFRIAARIPAEPAAAGGVGAPPAT
jgi:hypothetical protein